VVRVRGAAFGIKVAVVFENGIIYAVETSRSDAV
jgi:hypothetical protein